jgi:hypothetical protein
MIGKTINPYVIRVSSSDGKLFGSENEVEEAVLILVKTKVLLVIQAASDKLGLRSPSPLNENPVITPSLLL